MTRLKSPRLPNGLRNTISYFSFFSYAPSFGQIFTFFPQKTTKKELLAALTRQVALKRLVSQPFPAGKADPTHKNSSIYTLPQYSIYLKNRALRREISKNKLAAILPYLNALSRIPCIQLVGVSGSLSMENSKIDDDVDVCIVTSRNLLFTGRFLAILLAGVFGVRNTKSGACLNLFFDEQDLKVPESKQSVYVAHEILQLLPISDKNDTYTSFRQANRWTERFFPNASARQSSHCAPRFSYVAYMLQPVERLLKKIQLRIIKKNRTGLLVTATQLWLFRSDFEKKLARRRIKPS